jgi:NTP pyrophosphatase (non-canonical NTP hydrolase)
MSYFEYTQSDIDQAVKETRANYLAELALESFEVARSKGWEEDPRTFGEECMLITTEIGEAYDAWRRWEFMDMTPPGDNAKPEGVASEFADIFIRLLHYCHTRGIDLQAEYDRKTAYNRTRPYKHGGKQT